MLRDFRGMTSQLSPIGTEPEPSIADLVAQAIGNEAFIAACGTLHPGERAAIARAAIVGCHRYIAEVALAADADDPDFDEVLEETLDDPDFVIACNGLGRAARAKLARPALSAALTYLALWEMIVDIEHGRAGHA